MFGISPLSSAPFNGLIGTILWNVTITETGNAQDSVSVVLVINKSVSETANAQANVSESMSVFVNIFAEGKY